VETIWAKMTLSDLKIAMDAHSRSFRVSFSLAFALIFQSGLAVAGQLSEQAALDAFSVANEHCADVGVADVTVHATSVSKVAPAWAAVSEAYEAEGEAFLLYWRGVLAHCLDYQSKAASDLEDFVMRFSGSSENASQLRDARVRLRRLGVKVRIRETPQIDPRAGAVPGVVLVTSAGVLAALTVAQGLRVRSIEDELESVFHLREAITELQLEGEGLATSTNATLAASISCAVSSLISFAVWRGQLKAGKSKQLTASQLVLSAAPDLRGGFAFALEGRW
jgi:hypothetical protein